MKKIVFLISLVFCASGMEYQEKYGTDVLAKHEKLMEANCPCGFVGPTILNHLCEQHMRMQSDIIYWCPGCNYESYNPDGINKHFDSIREQLKADRNNAHAFAACQIAEITVGNEQPIKSETREQALVSDFLSNHAKLAIADCPCGFVGITPLAVIQHLDTHVFLDKNLVVYWCPTCCSVFNNAQELLQHFHKIKIQLMGFSEAVHIGQSFLLAKKERIKILPDGAAIETDYMINLPQEVAETKVLPEIDMVCNYLSNHHNLYVADCPCGFNNKRVPVTRHLDEEHTIEQGVHFVYQCPCCFYTTKNSSGLAQHFDRVKQHLCRLIILAHLNLVDDPMSSINFYQKEQLNESLANPQFGKFHLK